jgi:hypothetical protein
MSEIYMRKEVFWAVEKRNENARKLLLIIIILGLLLIVFVYKAKQDNSQIMAKFTSTERHKDIPKNPTRQEGNSTINEFVSCKTYMKDYYVDLYTQQLVSSLFHTCPNSDQSRDIENYYNYHMNGKLYSFRFENELIDDIKRLKNLTCFTSGKSYIALQTQHYPKCIEFKGLNIANFYKTRENDPNLYIKIYIYNVRVDKIHLHALKKQIIKESLIKKYTKSELPTYSDNVVIYTDDSGEKYMRICDILPNVEDMYENKFWFEISWNPLIQNMVCYESFKYIY